MRRSKVKELVGKAKAETHKKVIDEIRGAEWECKECGYKARTKEDPPFAWKIYDWGYPEEFLCKKCVGTGLSQVITWQLIPDTAIDVLNKILMEQQRGLLKCIHRVFSKHKDK